MLKLLFSFFFLRLLIILLIGEALSGKHQTKIALTSHFKGDSSLDLSQIVQAKESFGDLIRISRNLDCGTIHEIKIVLNQPLSIIFSIFKVTYPLRILLIPFNIDKAHEFHIPTRRASRVISFIK